jgi:uncharacterized UPF0160 family protein
MSNFLSAYLDVLSNTSIQSSAGGSMLVGTHDGSFHCDELLAVCMLKLLPLYAPAAVLRSRDLNLLGLCDIVVDVGAKYEPLNHRYDHHQREFDGTLVPKYSTKLSSAGLIYKHFGMEVISHIVKHSIPQDDETHYQLCNILYDKVYKGFVEHIDGIDNGVEVADGPLKYNVSTTLSNRVSYLAPAWNEPNSVEILNNRFKEGLKLVGNEFFSYVDRLIRIWWPARSIVQAAIDGRASIHPSQKIMLLASGCPWKDHIFDIENEVIILFFC